MGPRETSCLNKIWQLGKSKRAQLADCTTAMMLRAGLLVMQSMDQKALLNQLTESMSELDAMDQVPPPKRIGYLVGLCLVVWCVVCQVLISEHSMWAFLCRS